jgi:hypothetical protein
MFFRLKTLKKKFFSLFCSTPFIGSFRKKRKTAIEPKKIISASGAMILGGKTFAMMTSVQMFE